MKRGLSLILSLLLVLSLGIPALAAEPAKALQTISCPEMGFSTRCAEGYTWKYIPRQGITIYTEHAGYIPYVIVYRSEDWIVEMAEYIREQYTPHMKKQYGKDLISVEEFDHYRIAGRDLAVGKYTYKLQGHKIDLIRAYEVQDRHTVIYTAKYIQGQGDATLKALEQAVASYRPDPGYYEALAKAPRWENAVTVDENGDTLYTFGEVELTLPQSWTGLYSVKLNEDSISFYHSTSRSLWNEKDGYDGGLLFSLCWAAKNDHDYLPSYKDIGQTESGCYYLVFPTDVQAYNTPRAMEEYSQMYKQIDFVTKNARLLTEEAGRG